MEARRKPADVGDTRGLMEGAIRESGCEAYIAKPMSVMNFLNTVERFLS